jgi:hypothetical protein
MEHRTLMSRNLDTSAPAWRPNPTFRRLPRGPALIESTMTEAQFVVVVSRACSRCNVVSFSGFCPFCTGRVRQSEAA